jgi:hypothetical protein
VCGLRQMWVAAVTAVIPTAGMRRGSAVITKVSKPLHNRCCSLYLNI